MSSESSDDEEVASVLLFMTAISTQRIKRNERCVQYGKPMAVTDGYIWSVPYSCRRASLGGRDWLHQLVPDGPHGVRRDFTTSSGQDHDAWSPQQWNLPPH